MERTKENLIKSIKQALLATHTVSQVKEHHHYRGLDITSRELLGDNLNIRKSLLPQPDGSICLECPTMLDTLLTKLFELAQEYQNEKTIEVIHQNQYRNWQRMQNTAPDLASAIEQYRLTPHSVS